MAQDGGPSQQEPVVLAQDHELVRVLTECHQLATEREDDTAWRELSGRLDRVLEAIGVEAGDPTTAPATAEGPAVGRGTTDRAAASLLALLERPDEDQLELANRAVRDLETGLG